MSEIQISVIREQTHLFTAALISNTLQLLNVHLFDTLENGAAELLVLNGVGDQHGFLSLTLKV